MRFEARTRLPLEMGTFDVSVFTNSQGLDVVAVLHGKLNHQHNLAVRVHSSCFTSEVLGSQKCDCKQQLDYALSYVHKHCGIVLYLLQEGRGIGLVIRCVLMLCRNKAMTPLMPIQNWVCL